ncbi:restriction endonuclease [Melaminivora sp.]|uniref:restriction endonuclease n=1 Tax=Melaminivora sp. TaxID=1933032 RepID=UPI0028AFC4C8|nr:restriction endonuclease [Melaminivora sp.]
MTIPKFNAIKAALLDELQDGQPHLLRELVPVLARKFELTPEDLATRHASGALKFENLVRWARQHLKDDGTIQTPARGVVQITEQGTQRRNIGGFDEPLFRTAELPAISQSPDEALDLAMEQLTTQLRSDVLDRVRQVLPQQFERLVVDVLLAMGYGFDVSSGHVTRFSGDGGIDGLVHEDKLGLSSIYIQAKRYTENSVGRPEVQQFLGALTGAGATKGVFITSAGFTRDAREFAGRLQNQKVALIDGTQLARLMVEHGVGVATTKTLVIQHVDSDYFDAAWDTP